MASENSCEKNNTTTNCRPSQGNGYICIVVLYILLAIIIGSFVIY